jgi:hypothetical protein
VVYHLQEVEITEFRGSEHEVTFVKQTIQMGDGANKYDSNFQFVTESTANVFWEIFQSFSGPEICVKFYMYKDMVKVLYEPKD